MAQDRPDDDVTAVFKPGAAGPEKSEPVSFTKGADDAEPAAASAGGYDPTSAWSQPDSQQSAQPAANPYGQSWEPNAAQADPYAQNPYGQNPYGQNPYGQAAAQQNPYGQNPYGQQGYDPSNPYAQQPGSATSWDASQYPQYGQNAGYDAANPYAQQPPNPYGQYPQQQSYGAYQPGYAPPTNGMAIAAIILAFVFSPLGIVFGIMARNQIKQSGEAGDGMALAGIIIGGIFTALFVLAIVFVIIVGVAATSAVSSGIGGY